MSHSWWRRFRLGRRASEVEETGSETVPMSEQLAEFVRAVNTVESTDDPMYVRAVDDLRRDPAARVEELEQVSRWLGDSGHGIRQCLLMAAGALTSPESVPFLRQAALQTDDRERPTGAKDPACETLGAVAADEALRVQAVEGLETLAREGVPGAIEALVDMVEAPTLTVRAVSVVALNDLDGASEARDRAVARLTPAFRYLADLHRVDVRDVPQVTDPRRHLSEPVREEHPVPRLDNTDPWPGTDKPTPRIRE